ncbi:YhgE/Pip domain-containing protein, partial [Leucobacter soli]
MATFTRLRADRPVRWSTILGLLLVPVTVAGLLLWGLWKPDARLESITAAVVNLDEPVTVDGQTVPLGRVLAGELIGGADGSEDAGDAGGAAGTDTATGRDADADTDADAATASNFTWVLTDAADASAGAEDGRYAAVVTIPEDFSAAATSASRGIDEAEQAMIEVQTSDRGRLLDSALAGIVMSTATGVLNQTLGEQSVASVFVSMNELGDGIADAADGAGRLADGGSQLADGVDELA